MKDYERLSTVQFFIFIFYKSGRANKREAWETIVIKVTMRMQMV